MRKPPHVPPAGARSDDLLHEGLQLHRAGRLEEGAQRYRQVLASDPGHAAANHLLGLVYLQQGSHGRAIDHISRAVATRADPQYLCNLGVALNGAGRHEEAVIALRQATSADPNFAEAWSNLGMALRALHRPEEAATTYRRAVELKPHEPGFHYNLGNALSDAGEIVQAEAAFREALRLRPNYPAAVGVLAHLLLEHGRAEEGLVLVDTALTAAPADPQLHRRRGRLLQTLHRAEAAIAAYDRAIELRPGFGEAHLNRALTRRHETRDGAVDALDALFSDSSAPLDDRVFAGFGLAKSLADIGEHEASVGACLAVNRMHRARISFSLERAKAELAADLERFSGIENATSATGDDAPGPIFVVGLPRAGKSTIEAILSRHSRVAAAGELPTLGRLATRFWREHADGHAPRERLARLSREYLDEAQALVGAGRVVVDTMPLNYRHVGLVRAAFPRARIIWSHRDAASHCIAIFEKYLTGAGYEYAFDFDELLAFHGAYRNLAAGWLARAPDLVLEADVARLRADPEAGLRRLIDFCGLPWEDGLLAAAETEPQAGGWEPERISRNQAEHAAAWFRAVPALAALSR